MFRTKRSTSSSASWARAALCTACASNCKNPLGVLPFVSCFFQACFHAICVLLRHFAFFLGLDKRFSVYGQQLFVVPVTFHHILRLAPTSGGSSRFLANSAAQRPTLRSNAARLTKKRFEKWREKRVPSFWPPGKQTRGRWLCEGLASPFKEKKGSRTTELVLWLLREFNRAADKLADWVLSAKKIRQFVKHHWDAQRQAPGSASAMLAQHRAPSFSSIASGFTKPNSRHMASISSSSCLCHVSLERLTSHLQWILQAVTNKSSHLFITLSPPLRIPKFLSLLCVHEPPPRMRIILLSDIQICFCGGQGSLQAS